MWKIAPYSLTPRHVIPGLFAASLMVPAVNLLSLATHQIAAAWFAIVEARRFRDWRMIPVLPPVFFMIHAAYGFGIIRGLFENLCGQESDVGKAGPEYLELRGPEHED